jgi:Ca2+-transporting ATPase
VVANLALILTNRSWTRTILSMMREPNRVLWWVVGGAGAVLCLVLFVPWMQRLFHFSSPHLGDLTICLAVGACSVIWFEILKLRHRLRPKVSR